MQRAVTLYQTTIGKKLVMAFSGAIIVGFVIGHFLGNLNIYLGPEALNGYAAKLHGLPALVWGTRVLLLFAFSAHIGSAYQLWRRNVAARGSRYEKRQDLATDYAARTMYWTGPILLLYLIYHLLEFAIIPTHPGNVYRNVVEAFQNPWISAFYVAGNLALGLHMFHGIFSAFQSIGANHPRFNSYRRDLAIGVSAAITLGNVSFPISVLAGIVTL
jgi:succinate dehydrogenase / fumarate reductase cytochrome b subunit